MPNGVYHYDNPFVGPAATNAFASLYIEPMMQGARIQAAKREEQARNQIALIGRMMDIGQRMALQKQQFDLRQKAAQDAENARNAWWNQLFGQVQGDSESQRKALADVEAQRASLDDALYAGELSAEQWEEESERLDRMAQSLKQPPKPSVQAVMDQFRFYYTDEQTGERIFAGWMLPGGRHIKPVARDERIGPAPKPIDATNPEVIKRAQAIAAEESGNQKAVPTEEHYNRAINDLKRIQAKTTPGTEEYEFTKIWDALDADPQANLARWGVERISDQDKMRILLQAGYTPRSMNVTLSPALNQYKQLYAMAVKTAQEQAALAELKAREDAAAPSPPATTQPAGPPAAPAPAQAPAGPPIPRPEAAAGTTGFGPDFSAFKRALELDRRRRGLAPMTPNVPVAQQTGPSATVAAPTAQPQPMEIPPPSKPLDAKQAEKRRRFIEACRNAGIPPAQIMAKLTELGLQ